jgi:hypothetical protein
MVVLCVVCSVAKNLFDALEPSSLLDDWRELWGIIARALTRVGADPEM